MNKFKNTTTNKFAVTGSLLLIGSVAGYLLAGKDYSMRKPFSIIGGIVGLTASSFAISMLVEKQKED